MNNLVEWMVENEGPVVPLSSPKAKAVRFCEGSVVKNRVYLERSNFQIQKA